jgi:hypothetical protein
LAQSKHLERVFSTDDGATEANVAVICEGGAYYADVNLSPYSGVVYKEYKYNKKFKA